MVPKMLGRVDRVSIGQGDNDLPVISTHKMEKDFRGSSVCYDNVSQVCELRGG